MNKVKEREYRVDVDLMAFGYGGVYGEGFVKEALKEFNFKPERIKEILNMDEFEHKDLFGSISIKKLILPN